MIYKFKCAECGVREIQMDYREYEEFTGICSCGSLLERRYAVLNNSFEASGGERLRERLIEGIPESEIDDYLSTEKGMKAAEDYINFKHKEGKSVKERSSGVFDDIEPDGSWATSICIDAITNKQYNPKDRGIA